uniref:Uncharacterized protein n=1 Tax=Anguilla anguilla TaxID=7936 RepID=A0A0E9VLM3_ANGAN
MKPPLEEAAQKTTGKQVSALSTPSLSVSHHR